MATDTEQTTSVSSTTDYLTVQVICTGQTLVKDETNSEVTSFVRGQIAKALLVCALSPAEWSDLEVYARFQGTNDYDNIVYDVALDDEYQCEIPHEVTDYVGSFNVALYGENDHIRVLTSSPVSYSVTDTVGDNADGSSSSSPTQTVIQQALSAAETASTAATAANNAAETASTAAASIVLATEDQAREAVQNVIGV